MIIVRYADDFGVGFEHQEDGVRFRVDLAERLARFELELHWDKARLIEFGRFAATNRRLRGQGKPETFTFLGLTNICGKDRHGRPQLQRHTAKTRLRAKLAAIREACQKRVHLPIVEQGAWLRSVVQGHFNYHAVPTNFRSLGTFRDEVTRHWLRALRRRSQRARVPWTRMTGLVARWLPAPKILHPWPDSRFAGRLQGRSPVRQQHSPGSVRGGGAISTATRELQAADPIGGPMRSFDTNRIRQWNG